MLTEASYLGDALYGGSGRDTLYGGLRRDSLYGEAGLYHQLHRWLKPGVYDRPREVSVDGSGSGGSAFAVAAPEG